MPIIETPPLLILGSETEYIQRLQLEYNGKTITIPENKIVIFYLSQEADCKHCFCGKNNTNFNPMRAQRILWIKFLLETQNVRVIKKNISNNNIIFVCSELKYVIICCLLKNGNLKFITQYILSGDDIKKFQDPTKYTDYTFT